MISLQPASSQRRDPGLTEIFIRDPDGHSLTPHPCLEHRELMCVHNTSGSVWATCHGLRSHGRPERAGIIFLFPAKEGKLREVLKLAQDPTI